jgi:hypothetical protein
MAQATQGAAVAVISASELAYFALLLASYCTATRAQWYMALASRSWQACLRTTMRLFSDLLVKGAMTTQT